MTAIDLSTFSYDSKSFSVNAQETNPRGVQFKTDGTKMYIVGNTNDTIYQYSLSTARDVSTASYDSKSLSVSAQSTVTENLYFKPDGTKVYVLDSDPDDVYQYSLSTARDISTGSYDSKVLSVSVDSTAKGITISGDGTRLFMTGNAEDKIFSYTMSTARDVSTGSYDNKSFSLSSQETNVRGHAFNDDGTQFVMVGTGNNTAYQYTLSTAYDVTTTSVDTGKTLDGSSEQTGITAVTFGDSFTKIYMMGPSSDTVYQYSGTAGSTFVPMVSFID